MTPLRLHTRQTSDSERVRRVTMTPRRASHAVLRSRHVGGKQRRLRRRPRGVSGSSWRWAVCRLAGCLAAPTNVFHVRLYLHLNLHPQLHLPIHVVLGLRLGPWLVLSLLAILVLFGA